MKLTQATIMFLHMQKERLMKWESILQPDIYQELKNIVVERSLSAKTANDIPRGTDIDQLVPKVFRR